MHGPPAAAWKSGAAKRPGWILAALLGIATLALFFFIARQGFGPASLLLLALLPISGVTAWSGLRHSAVGHLRWDGAQWHWAGRHEYHVTDVTCLLDLQQVLLLRLRCEDGPGMWLWLESNRMDAAWLAMRRAVVAGAPASGSNADNSLPK